MVIVCYLRLKPRLCMSSLILLTIIDNKVPSRATYTKNVALRKRNETENDNIPYIQISPLKLSNRFCYHPSVENRYNPYSIINDSHCVEHTHKKCCTMKTLRDRKRIPVIRISPLNLSNRFCLHPSPLKTLTTPIYDDNRQQESLRELSNNTHDDH